ncbi:helix-turn-helix transcriptional regulator [Luteimonas sp. TWI1416]|uniref:helix-turn-helix domain-containing protein n=1 Tax=unclassified Luteimonas TaxID=2629088 RepID=UPI0032091F5C
MGKKSIHRPEYKILTKLVRKMRDEANLDQADLADLLVRPQSYVSNVERGQRRLDLLELRDICMHCGLDLIEFVKRFEEAVAEANRKPS